MDRFSAKEGQYLRAIVDFGLGPWGLGDIANAVRMTV